MSITNADSPLNPLNHDYAYDVRNMSRACHVCGRHEADHKHTTHYYAAGYPECLYCGQLPIDPWPRARGYQEGE